ncbi:MAG: hypothetical protein OXI88_00425 [Gammaproteobacteria bacterium]|nr:hypothetical protein [Gammaproteobacteria bacterium]MDE0286832.1 hypothetical protein [Gammaproteobacteria bacterium]MDE0510245.1 hypothetical protein [Gammaproteobacteria bacterium]
MNQVAIVFGLIITSVVGFGAYTALAPLLTQSENRNMEAEIINVINAASEYRWVNRGEAGLAAAGFDDLVDNGYLDSELYDDGGDESVIETDITASPGATPPVVTYDAGDAESCNWLLQRAETGKWTNVDADAAANACATATLTVVIE